MEEQVTTLDRLAELALEKRSVSVNTKDKINWLSFKCKPAAFVISMQGRLILRMFQVGMYVYEKKEKRNG